MENTIDMDILNPEDDGILGALEAGMMVIARSENSFFYAVIRNHTFLLFTHTLGSAQGNKKELWISERNSAIVKGVISVADLIFTVKYKPHMDVFSVMVTAEEAISYRFPYLSTGKDIEFIIPGRKD